MTKDNRDDLVDAVQRDHREVEEMLETVSSASGAARQQAFEQLAAKLKAHETAEQKVVHPLTAKGDADEAEALEAEESEASTALDELANLDVDSPEFERGFANLKADVLAHAQEEEADEHPRLLRETSADELARRAKMFEDAEESAAKT